LLLFLLPAYKYYMQSNLCLKAVFCFFILLLARVFKLLIVELANPQFYF
jgi:hypothetical protein